ncbi:N-acetylglucosaminyl-phosphatidylinositol [Podospora aff. communis PSN243]|uniref:N-acetylglucosaminyl-phosphatidylinositol n=1 Tax=Podospora aff. communis PSN243 TaxID=3040156 RepID=A0AAV9GR21_9PEZI|nr:N-acetylglucosaminyl-phosphatidylinositol [Podospora aff. communis PSN243]
MNNLPPSRPFSTSARVHPSFLPYLGNASRGKGLKWIPPLAGLIAVGYGVSAFREVQIEKHLAQAKEAEQAELAQRRKNMALADAYGDRTNLEELERAMRVYEAQQRNE